MSTDRRKFTIKRTLATSSHPAKAQSNSKPTNGVKSPSGTKAPPLKNGNSNRPPSSSAPSVPRSASSPTSEHAVLKAQFRLSNARPIEAQSFPGAPDPQSRISQKTSTRPANSPLPTARVANQSPAPSSTTVSSGASRLRKRPLDSDFATPSTPSKKFRPTIDVEVITSLAAALRSSDESHAIWTGNALKHARLQSAREQRAFDTVSPFETIAPNEAGEVGTLRLNRLKKTYKDRFEPIPKSDVKVAKTSYTALQHQLPKFKHYTSVSQSITGPERQTIRVVPEVDQADEQKQAELEDEISSNYGDLTEQRASELRQRHLRASLSRPIGRCLSGLGIHVEDVLSYLLEPDVPNFPKPLLDQRGPLFNEPKPDRDLDVADALMRSQLGPGRILTSDILHRAHDACTAIHETIPELNVLELLRTIYQEKRAQGTDVEQPQRLTGQTCRLCFQEHCLLHGAFFDDDNDGYDNKPVTVKERLPPLSSIQQQETFATVMEFDNYGFDENGNLQSPPYKSAIFPDKEICCEDCFWTKANRRHPSKALWTEQELDRLEELLQMYASDLRAPCAIAMFLESKSCIDIAHKSTEIIQQKCDSSGTSAVADSRSDKRNGKNLIRRIGKAQLLHERKLYYPCSHAGSCEDAKCSCWENEVLCEKFCMCSQDCERRVQGCKCSRNGNICGTQQCPCYRMSRECDPDICGSCGAHELLDPVRRREPGIERGRCRNVPNQRNIAKKTYMGKAQFGFGLFMGEPISKDEYISEYKGEVICRAEAERRGLTSAFMQNQYLFSINLDVDNDATYAANKTRHINHSSDARNINVYVRMALCNGVTRLGMFASRDIAVGEELLFNYHYQEKDLTKFFEKEGHRSIEVGKGLKGVRAEGKSVGRQRTSTGVPMAAAKSFPLQEAYTAEQLYSGLDSSQPDPEDDFATIPLPPDDQSDLDFVQKSSPRKSESEFDDVDTPRRRTRRRNAIP